MLKYLLTFASLLVSFSVIANPAARELSNPQATSEVRSLYKNLSALQGNAFLFGHQDSLAYGYDWQALLDTSDVKHSSGSFPALYGWILAV